MNTLDRDKMSQWVTAARNGDVSAYGLIVRETEGMVNAAVRRIVPDPHESQDIVQEVYLRAFARLSSLQDCGSLLAWLQRIARRLALNHVRARRWSFADIDLSELPDPDADSPNQAAADQAALARAMLALSPANRRLCERYYHGGWPTSRLATDESLSEAGVRKRLQRIRDRLREEMVMGTSELSDKIIELLSRPNLTTMPENPVGALWAEFQTAFSGFQVVDLPERIDRDAFLRLFGDADAEHMTPYLDSLSRQDWLRSDLTKPMLIAACGTRAPTHLIATGKTYRLGDEGATRLQAFHQAEALWMEEGLDEWQMMNRIVPFLDRVTQGARLRITQVDYPLDCVRGWQVDAEWPDGKWSGVCGWGRVRDEVVARLGPDPAKVTAVGVGVGLERLACLRYGIDDIRKVAAARC